MDFLKKFSDADRTMLVALPYRAGLWVSSSDATGGSDSDRQERDALEKTIAGLMQGMFESAFVHEVISETFLRKAEWSNWTGNVQDVPAECRTVMALLQRQVSDRDMDAYRRTIMQVGLEVARAFREYDDHAPLVDRVFRGISLAFERLFGVLQREKFAPENILNVSYEEDVALNTLAKALRGDANNAGANIGVITNS